MVVSRREVDIASHRLAVGVVLAPHDERHLGVRLVANGAVHDVPPALLQPRRPVEDRFLVEPRHQLDHHGHFLPLARRVDQDLHQLRVGAGAIHRLLDGDHARIVRGGADEVDHRQERLERVMQQHILLLQHAEKVVGIDRRREARLERRVLEIRALDLVRDLAQPVQVHRPFDAVQVGLLQAELLQEEFGHALGAVVGDLEPHRVAEVPVQQLALHRGVQVLDLLLVHEQIRIARDAELVGAEHAHAGEQLAHVSVQDRRQEHERVWPAGDRLRQANEARQRARRLHDRGARVRLAAHRLERLRGGARVRTRLGKPELDAFLQPGDADLEELVEVGGDDGDETQPLEQRHRVVGRHRQHAAVERENAELAVEKLRRKRCSAVHGEASILPVPCYRIRAMARHDTLAAVDLGSNSFHLQIGRVVDGQIYPLDALREVVRLGAGLTAEKRIDRGTQAQALETLAKFAERLRGFSRQAIRAVGTNALRVAKNSPQFLREARQVLGFPIEVISGREEARLIYLGVAHALPAAVTPQHTRRLVIDIGGGSTELIIGTGFEPQLTESLYMGCLSYSLKFFADGKIDKPRMKAAELAARQELAGIVHAYRAAGWGEAGGSSRSEEHTSELQSPLHLL